MLANNQFKTYFAPAERSSDTEVMESHKIVTKNGLFVDLADRFPDILVVLDKNRQVIFANETLLKIAKERNQMSVLGKRFGEIWNCIHSSELAGGCGTTEACRYCGAVNAILNTQKSKTGDVQECRITCDPEKCSVDMRVWASFLELDGEPFIIFIAKDISDEKRRRALERIFFHDIMNTAGGIQGVIPVIHSASKEELDQLLALVENSAETLIEEIKAQKDLLAAENGELQTQMEETDSISILDSVVKIYLKHLVCEDKKLVIAPSAKNIRFTSDKRLVKRVIGNMVKNALEATPPGGTVIVSSELSQDGWVCFKVHNPTSMPKEVQLQIFQRSFSTKGNGRGLGTYSIRLLTERYLNGRVSFTSSEKEGTCFTASFPLKPM